MITDPITTISDEQLTRWVRSAWFDAARCWREARQTPHPMVVDSARSAEQYWNHLVSEQRRRGLALDPVVDPSVSVDQHGDATMRLYTRPES